jgi:hypothetical protein
MGVAFDYFRADDDGIARRVGGVLGGPVAAGHPGTIETKGVDPYVRVGHLYFRVRGRDWEYDDAIGSQVLPTEPIGPENWEEPTVERLSDQVRDTLAEVTDEDRRELGRWWATTEEFVRDRTDPAYVETLCAELLAMCRRARDDGQHVYVWSCL